MNVIFGFFFVVSFFGSFLALTASQSVVHEIYSGILFLTSMVCLLGIAANDTRRATEKLARLLAEQPPPRPAPRAEKRPPLAEPHAPAWASTFRR